MFQRTALIPFFGLLVLLMGTTSAPQSVTVASVTAGGATHLVVYPLNDSSKATRVEAALPTIITDYETLWNGGSPPNTPMAFRLLIDAGLETPSGEDLSASAFESVALPVPSAPAAWNGATENTPTSACHVRLFDAPALGQPNRLEFELALAVARCYLLHSGSSAPQDWWLKGLANWMAVQVYSPPAPVLASLQKDYQDNYNTNVLNGGDEAMYFWEFLLGGHMQNSPLGSLPAAMQGLNNMSQTRVNLTPDLFYAYADVVAQDGLPWQPAVADLADDTDVSLSLLPADIELDLEENSIYITNVTLPEEEEGKGVTITAENLADSGTVAAIGSGGSFTPIADGEPLDLCGQTDVTVVSGRAAASNPNSVSLSGPSLTVSLKDPCEQAKLPPCIVGTWQADVPYTIGYISTDGMLIHTYRPDGSFTHQYTNYVVTFNLPNDASYNVTYITTTFTGTMTSQRDPTTPGRYKITSWQRQMSPGGEVTMDRGGQTTDVTSQITMDYFGDGVPSYYQCDTDNAQNTHFTGYLTGSNVEALGATTWSFTRVPNG